MDKTDRNGQKRTEKDRQGQKGTENLANDSQVWPRLDNFSRNII